MRIKPMVLQMLITILDGNYNTSTMDEELIKSGNNSSKNKTLSTSTTATY